MFHPPLSTVCRRPRAFRFAAALLLACSLGLTGCAPQISVTAEADETIDTWMAARRYQAEGRYELAKQYYSLALASARTQSALDQRQRELFSVDMQIRTLR